MNVSDIIVIAIITIVIGLAVLKTLSDRKKGIKCAGCPHSRTCASCPSDGIHHNTK